MYTEEQLQQKQQVQDASADTSTGLAQDQLQGLTAADPTVAGKQLGL